MKILSLEEFNEVYHQWKVSKYSSNLQSKVPKKKWKLTKRKVVSERVVEVRYNEAGIPYEYELKKKVTKEAPDTNQFTNMVVEYLKSVWGSQTARRISSEGRFRPNKNHPSGGTWLKGQNNGIEDVQAVINGRIVAIEVKFTKTDTMRPAQIKRREEVISDGGVYIIARNFEQLQEDLIEQLA